MSDKVIPVKVALRIRPLNRKEEEEDYIIKQKLSGSIDTMIITWVTKSKLDYTI